MSRTDIQQLPHGKGFSERKILWHYKVRGHWHLDWKFFARWIALTFLFFLLSQVNIFGLGETTKHFSQTVFYQWMAPCYGKTLFSLCEEEAIKNGLSKSTKKPDISVVLLLEQDLDVRKGWPASYELHADILERILDYGPKAVVVDFAFVDPERTLHDPTIDDLEAVIQENREIPVFFVADYGSDLLTDKYFTKLSSSIANLIKGQFPIDINTTLLINNIHEILEDSIHGISKEITIRELREQKKEKEILALFNGIKESIILTIERHSTEKLQNRKLNEFGDNLIRMLANKIPLQLSQGIIHKLYRAGGKSVAAPGNSFRRRAIRYPLIEVGSHLNNIPDGEHRPSAALAVYQHLANDNQEDQLLNKPSESSFLELTWKIYQESNEGNLPIYNGPFKCNRQELNLFSRIWQSLRLNITPSADERFNPEARNKSLDGKSGELRQECPPHNTISAGYLRNPPDQEAEKQIENTIKDHVVFYGGYLNMVNDLVIPPTHDPIPGVYFHTMALDNLIQYGKQYIHEGEAVLFGYNGSDLMDLLWIAVLLLVVEYGHHIWGGIHKPDLYRRAGDSNYQVGNEYYAREKLILPQLLYILCTTLWLIVLCISISLINFQMFHYPPSNFIAWVGLIGIRETPLLVYWYKKAMRNIPLIFKTKH